MTNQEFIEEIAKYAIKYAPQFDIKVISPIIAQACLESAFGTSDKVIKDGVYRHNYFGLKWRNNRCQITNEYFEEFTSEQNKDTTYTIIKTKFFKFNSLSDCVLGYFQWTNIPNYSNLKNVTDPRQYVENIKKDGYATSIKYVENILNVIDKYDLKRFDKMLNQGDSLKITESILTKNPCYIKGEKITVKGLMLHSVGCSQPSAKVFVNSWNSASKTNACVHAFIDANTGEVYQTLPWTHRGWHAGGSANNTHIGVEMCEPDCIKYTSGSNFTCSDVEKARKYARTTYEAAVELFAFLCKQFNLNPLTDICSHSEGHTKGIASGHADPEHLWKQLNLPYTMDTFRKAVSEQTGCVEEQKPTETINAYQPGLYKVNVELNIRKGPGVQFDIVGCIKDNGIYTITEIQNNSWGRLKSGAGWINVDKAYCSMSSSTKSYKYTTDYKTTANVNIRSTPEIKDGNVIDTIPKGTKVKCDTEQVNISWRPTEYNGQVGFVSVDYLIKDEQKSLTVGQKVHIKSGCNVYGTNKQFASFVYNSDLYIRDISGDRIVISTLQTGAITGAVNINDILV